MRHWHTFKETMNHEMDDVDINLSKKGYKLDGTNGIKISIKVNQYKSVDYIADGCVSLVEFSDLYRDRYRMDNKIEEVSNSNLSEDSIKMITKDFSDKIHKDLIAKFNGTISIITQMQKIEFCHELERYTKNNTLKKYLIIIAPFFHHTIPENKRAGLARVINQLQNNVTSGLPQALNAKATIIPLDKYSR